MVSGGFPESRKAAWVLILAGHFIGLQCVGGLSVLAQAPLTVSSRDAEFDEIMHCPKRSFHEFKNIHHIVAFMKKTVNFLRSNRLSISFVAKALVILLTSLYILLTLSNDLWNESLANMADHQIKLSKC